MTPERIRAALDATWPPARVGRCGPFVLRDGAGGGQRTDAARLDGIDGRVGAAQIAAADAAMRAAGRRPLYMVRDGQAALDRCLAAAGHAMMDPVVALAGPIGPGPDSAGPDSAVPAPAGRQGGDRDPAGFGPVGPRDAGPHRAGLDAVGFGPAGLNSAGPSDPGCHLLWPPLAIMDEIWTEGGIGPARRAVMARVRGPHVAILARDRDAAAGVCFAAVHATTAMVHALHVRPAHRRRGVGARLMRAVRRWAAGHGASDMAVLVTRENAGALALYHALGLVPCDGYHYRRARFDVADPAPA